MNMIRKSMLKRVIKEPAAVSDTHMNLNLLQPSSTWKIYHKKKCLNKRARSKMKVSRPFLFPTFSQ
jgi:hypothetical protein